MKNVFLTGSTGGIGSAIAACLGTHDYRIVPIHSRLEDLSSLEEEVIRLQKKTPVDVLINAAGLGRFDPHETLAAPDIPHMIAVNFTAPILLAHLCLRHIKARQGHIVHIASIEALRWSRWSALYSGTKAGLRHFSLTLYEEIRKSGARVTCINPDLVRTPFFDDLSFHPQDGPEYAIDPADMASTVLHVLTHSDVITELTIRPIKMGIHKKGRSATAVNDGIDHTS